MSYYRKRRQPKSAEDILSQINKIMADMTPGVSYMATQFNRMAAANIRKRIKKTNTGSLNMRKLANYKTSENVFLRRMTTPTGKNHALVLIVDWSSSMLSILRDTLRQVVTLALFAEKTGIPMYVYGFTSCHYNTSRPNYDKLSGSGAGAIIADAGFAMLELYNSTKLKTGVKRREAMGNLLYLGITKKFPSGYSMGGTPLVDAAVASVGIYEKIIADTGVDILNSIWITDGQGGGGCDNYQTVIDEKTKYEVSFTDSYDCLQLQIAAHKIAKSRVPQLQLFGYFIGKSEYEALNGMRHMGFSKYAGGIDPVYDQKKGYAFASNEVWDGYYGIASNTLKDKSRKYIDINGVHNTKQLSNAFTDNMKKKQVNKVLLNHFAEKLAKMV